MTKQDAIRAITEAKTLDELRTVLLVIVSKLHWEITLPGGLRTLDVPVRQTGNDVT